MEMIIVVIVMGIMAAALTPLAMSSFKAYDAVLGDLVVLDKLRYATERLAREIREVKYDSVSKAFLFDVSGMGASTMSFHRDYETPSGPSADTQVVIGTTTSGSPCAVTNKCMTLTYSLPSGVGAQVLTDEVSAITFNYLDANGLATGVTAATVRYVEIDLALSHTINGASQPYTQHTRVELKRYPGGT
jgi:hypothetical protein